MVVEALFTAIIPWLGQWATETIASSILNNANSQLNKKDIEKALKRSISAAEAVTNKQLFFSYDDRNKRLFLDKYFQQPEVLKQLTNPLIDKAIDLKLLEFAFTETIKKGDDKYNEINQDYIKSWLEVFKTEYLKEIGTYIKYQYAKADYFKQLANNYDHVKFSGIDLTGKENAKSEKLLKIFVMQNVKKERKGHSYRLRENYFLASDDNEITRKSELLRQQREFEDSENYVENSVSAQNLLKKEQAKKVVVLGAPGSGKTTLMSYFSVAITENKSKLLGLDPNIDWLPIFIGMRDYILHDNLGILEYYYSQFSDNDLSVKSLPDGFFEHWLETGRALILLDGLDEIVDEGKRGKIVKKIENFVSNYEQNRVIITSRPAGYRRDFFDAETFPHYWLQPFDDNQINEFIENWYNSRTPNKNEAKLRKDNIRKALDNTPRIKLLARNPLLLTIIALIHRYQKKLPKERYKLYESAIQTLLTTWDTTNKLLENHTKLQYLENDDWEDIMQNLAYWIHGYQEGIKGDELEGTLIDKDELIIFLTNYIKSSKKISFNYAEKEAQRFINFIQDRSGLLNEQGTDCYAFVHKTFQEYLCAQKFQQKVKEDYDEFDSVLNEMNTHLNDAHWREVILLFVAQQTKNSVAKAIRSILNHKSDYEQWLHRNLLFAGSCLAENPKGLNDADESLVKDILERLVSLEVSETKIGGLRNELFKVFCSLYETEFAPQCLELLKAKSSKIEKDRLLKYRAELGEQETVINELIEQLSDQSLSEDVREYAAFALGRLGKDSQEVITALLNTVSDHRILLCECAGSVLRGLGKNSQEVITALVNALSDPSQDEYVRAYAVNALGHLGKDSQEVITALLNALSDASLSGDVRGSAAEALGKLGNDSQEVITALLNALSDQSQREDVRRSAAYALGELGNDSQEVIIALLNALSDQSQREDVRRSAAYALGELGNDSQEVITALLNALSDQSQREDVSRSAAYALGELGNDSQEAITALLNALSDQNQREDVRRSAAYALGELRNDSQEVITALVNALSDQSLSQYMRRSAANVLGELGNDSQEVITALLNALSDQSQREKMRLSATYALGELGNDSQEVITALLNALSDPGQREDVRRSAANALGKLGNDSQEVITALLNALSDQSLSQYMRQSVVNTLGNLGKTSDQVLPLVEQWIETNEDSEFVGNGIDVLWRLVA